MQDERTHRMTDVYALIKPGVSLDAAQADVTRVADRLHTAYPGRLPGRRRASASTLTPWREMLVQKARPTLLILMGAVGLVLLVACANVGNLTLARLVRRERELAVRAALGATPVQLRRQLLVEHLVLAVAGSALGVGIACDRARRPRRLRRAPDAARRRGRAERRRARVLARGQRGRGHSLRLGAAPAVRRSRPRPAPPARIGRADAPSAARSAARSARSSPRRSPCRSSCSSAPACSCGRSSICSASIPASTRDSVLSLKAPNFTRLPRRQEPRALRRADGAGCARIPASSRSRPRSRAPFDAVTVNRAVSQDRHRAASIDPQPPVQMLPTVVSASYFPTLKIPILRGRTFGADDTPTGAARGDHQRVAGAARVRRRRSDQPSRPVVVRRHELGAWRTTGSSASPRTCASSAACRASCRRCTSPTRRSRLDRRC